MIRAIAWKRPHLTLLALAAGAGAALTGPNLAGAAGPEASALHAQEAAEPALDTPKAVAEEAEHKPAAASAYASADPDAPITFPCRMRPWRPPLRCRTCRTSPGPRYPARPI